LLVCSEVLFYFVENVELENPTEKENPFETVKNQGNGALSFVFQT